MLCHEPIYTPPASPAGPTNTPHFLPLPTSYIRLHRVAHPRLDEEQPSIDTIHTPIVYSRTYTMRFSAKAPTQRAATGNARKPAENHTYIVNDNHRAPAIGQRRGVLKIKQGSSLKERLAEAGLPSQDYSWISRNPVRSRGVEFAHGTKPPNDPCRSFETRSTRPRSRYRHQSQGPHTGSYRYIDDSSIPPQEHFYTPRQRHYQDTEEEDQLAPQAHEDDDEEEEDQGSCLQLLVILSAMFYALYKVSLPYLYSVLCSSANAIVQYITTSYTEWIEKRKPPPRKRARSNNIVFQSPDTIIYSNPNLPNPLIPRRNPEHGANPRPAARAPAPQPRVYIDLTGDTPVERYNVQPRRRQPEPTPTFWFRLTSALSTISITLSTLMLPTLGLISGIQAWWASQNAPPLGPAPFASHQPSAAPPSNPAPSAPKAPVRRRHLAGQLEHLNTHRNAIAGPSHSHSHSRFAPPQQVSLQGEAEHWNRRSLQDSRANDTSPSNTPHSSLESSAIIMPFIEIQFQAARDALSNGFAKLQSFFRYTLTGSSPEAEEMMDAAEAAFVHRQALEEQEMQMRDIFANPVPRVDAQDGRIIWQPKVGASQPGVVTHRMGWKGESEQVPEALSCALSTALTHLSIHGCNVSLNDVISIISMSVFLESLEVQQITPEELAIAPSILEEEEAHDGTVIKVMNLTTLKLTSHVPLDTLFDEVRFESLSHLSLRLLGRASSTDFDFLAANTFRPSPKPQIFQLRANVPPWIFSNLQEAMRSAGVHTDFGRTWRR